MTKLTIHQIWIGDAMPETERSYADAIKQAAEEACVFYKRWSIKDIELAFGHEEMFFFFRRIFFRYPYPHLLKIAADYYRWRILALTPEGEESLMLDASVQLNKQQLSEIKLPKKNITIGGPGGGAFGFIHVRGGKVASDLATAAENAINGYFDLGDAEFERQLLEAYKPYGERTPAHIDNQWALEYMHAHKIKFGCAAARWYTLASFKTESQKAMFVRHALSVSQNKEEMLQLHADIVEAYEKKHTAHQVQLCVLMSTAGEYDETSVRTLQGILTAEQLRQVQRAATFSQELYGANLRYYFVMDTMPTHETEDVLFVKDALGIDFKALKMTRALRWVAKNIEPDYLFLCCDDSFIHLPRLEDFCKRYRPGAVQAIVSADTNNTPQIGGGILLPAGAVRRLASQEEMPKKGEVFGEYIARIASAAGLEITPDMRLSCTKSNYPAKRNRIISTHHVNPYDLLYLYEENFS